MHAGTRRGGDRLRNVGAVTRSPTPSRTFPGLLTRIYPAFYQGTPPQPFSPGRIANQPLRCVWNLPSLPTPDNAYVTGRPDVIARLSASVMRAASSARKRS